MAFWDWWKTAPEARTEDSRLAYLKQWPMPAAWTIHAVDLNWPDRFGEDLFDLLDEGANRSELFALTTAAGLPGEAEWLADFEDDAKWD